MGLCATGCAARRGAAERPLTILDVYTALDAERRAAIEGPTGGAERFATLRARHPGDVYLRAREAELLLAEDRDRARALLAVPEAEGSADARYVLGRIAATEGRLDEARAHYEAAWRLAPDDPRPVEAAFTLGFAEDGKRGSVARLRRAIADGASPTFDLVERGLGYALDLRDEIAVAELAAHHARTHPGRAWVLRAYARRQIPEAPDLALALLRPLPDGFEVVGEEFAALEAIRSRRRDR